MKVLLDECVPRKLRRELTKHQVLTVTECGWSVIENGELLSLAQNKFDVFLTIDQNVTYQQNLRTFNIAIVLMVATLAAKSQRRSGNNPGWGLRSNRLSQD